jgi:uncharacterized protein YkwD
MKLCTSTSLARRRVLRLAGTVAALAVLSNIPAMAGGASAPSYTLGYERPATNDEYALLVLANRARVENNAQTKPLMWSDKLGLAARYHSWDMIVHKCFQHSSCNGETLSNRITRFYGGAWSGAAENIAVTGTPQIAHDGWMASTSTHRANILNSSMTEFGGALIMDASDFRTPYGTEDFVIGPAKTIPALVAAAVLQPQDYSSATAQWQLALNYYDAQGRAAQSIRALVDGTPKSLSRVAGTNGNGTWNGFVATPQYPASFCKKVVFEVVDANGNTSRWPTSGAIGLGFDDTCMNVWQSGTTTPTSATTTTTVTTPPVDPSGQPVVTITAPTDGARVTTSVIVRATATDDGIVKYIELWVDGVRKYRKAGGMMARQWNAGASTVKPGAHTITVKAYDDTGTVGTKSITVTK